MAIGRSMRFQTSAIIIASFLLSHLVGLLLYTIERRGALGMTEAMDRAERSADISRLVDDLPAEWRDGIVRLLDSRALRVWTSAEPAVVVPGPTRADSDVTSYLRAQVLDRAESDVRVRFMGEGGLGIVFRDDGYRVVPPPSDPATRVGRPGSIVNAPDGAPSLAISIRRADGQWLNFVGLLNTQRTFLPGLLLANLVSAAIGVALVAFWLVGRVTSPLARLSEAAENLGRSLSSDPLPTSGPREVAVAAAAFNRMQRRLVRLVQSRTELLAGISHDLRTPLTQIRLRLEMMPASPEREKNLRTLDDVDATIGTFLSYARASHEMEEKSRIDLGALVGSICDDLADSGAAIDCDCPTGLVVSCKRLAIKRAVTNLVENALKYGHEARVSTGRTRDGVVVAVEDRGPGIPASQLEAVFAPFYRGETSRSLGSSGVGLGLSIAQAIAEDHGGEVRLTNRREGGLRAELLLPQ
jgi:signal transduction histidine kinase